NIKALVLDLAHFEERLSLPLLGLIGYEVLKKWEIAFDYTQQTLTLHYGQQRNVPEQLTVTRVPFQLLGHLIAFELHIEGQPYQLILDSASGANFLDKSINSKHLLDTPTPIQVRSADNIDAIYTQSLLTESSISNTQFFNQPFVRSNLKEMLPKLDGLLGFPFLSCCKISVNYRKRELIIWNVHTIDLLAER
ncbi:MAG: hypothetical protein AAF738_10235, partial [Bacteroidota bacterium]